MLKTCYCILTNAHYLPELKGDVIGVDKGALLCLEHGIQMHYLIGDFDSITEDEKSVLKKQFPDLTLLPERKDVSDSEAAVLWAKQQRYQRIVLVSSMSGRFDHGYVNFKLVEKYGCELLDESNHIFLVEKGTTVIYKDNWKYVSFFACDEAEVTLEGFSYPLDHYHLTKTDVLCLSNEILKDQAIVTTTSKLWCIQSNDKK